MKKYTLKYKDLICRLFTILGDNRHDDAYIRYDQIDKFEEILREKLDKDVATGEKEFKLNFEHGRTNFLNALSECRDLFREKKDKKGIIINPNITPYDLVDRMGAYPNELFFLLFDREVEIRTLAMLGYGKTYIEPRNCQDYVDDYSAKLIEAMNRGDYSSHDLLESIMRLINKAPDCDEECQCNLQLPDSKKLVKRNEGKYSPID